MPSETTAPSLITTELPLSQSWVWSSFQACYSSSSITSSIAEAVAACQSPGLPVPPEPVVDGPPAPVAVVLVAPPLPLVVLPLVVVVVPVVVPLTGLPVDVEPVVTLPFEALAAQPPVVDPLPPVAAVPVIAPL